MSRALPPFVQPPSDETKAWTPEKFAAKNATRLRSSEAYRDERNPSHSGVRDAATSESARARDGIAWEAPQKGTR